MNMRLRFVMDRYLLDYEVDWIDMLMREVTCWRYVLIDFFILTAVVIEKDL